MKRNPHPARRSRIATLGISTSAFVSIVTGLVWNTHQAELVADLTDANAALVEKVTPVTGTTTQVAPVAGSTTPTATIAPSAPAAPTNKNAPTTVAPATPANNAVAPTVVPAAPAPAPVVYTCMSPGGNTESPTASGSCQNARYGYVLTQI
jgi:hypothetical protein